MPYRDAIFHHDYAMIIRNAMTRFLLFSAFKIAAYFRGPPCLPRRTRRTGDGPPAMRHTIIYIKATFSRYFAFSGA